MFPRPSLYDEVDDASGVGATSTPPAPDVPAPDSVPGAAPSSELDLQDILEMDDTGEYTPPAPTKPAVPTPAAAPAVPPGATPPAAPTPPPQAAPTPPVPTTPAQPVAPAEPALPVEQQPQQPAPDFAALRQAEYTRLEAAYALSDEDARMMAVEPERVIPKLAANLHLQVFEAVMHGITNYLPQVIEAQTQQRTTRESVRNEFFSEFPALQDGKFQRDVEAALVTYRQFNPSGTRAQAIAHAGVNVSLAHGLPLPEKYFKGMAGATAPASSGAPPAPFTPAAPGASQTPAPPPTSNYYAKIAEEDLEY